MEKIKRLVSGILVMLLLCGCVGGTPTETTTGGNEPEIPVSWLENHTTEIPDYVYSEKSLHNQALAKQMYEQFLQSPPVDFTYGGIQFSQDMASWDCNAEKTNSGTNVTYTHRTSGLQVELQYYLYENSSAVEWKIRVKNSGSENSPVIENFYTLSGQYDTKGNASLFYSKGANATDDDFEPVTVRLKDGDSTWISCNGGRSSSGTMPFFNLYTSSDKGYIAAIGWSGQWKAEFERVGGFVTVKTRMTDSNWYLKPGESVMLPSMLLLPWEGDAQDAHNDLRRYIIQHHTPTTDDGELYIGPVSHGTWGGSGAEWHLNELKAILNRNLDTDVFWVDAGWYGDPDKYSSTTFDSIWQETVGTWTEIDALYPNEIEEVSLKVNENGMGYLLWFEPERAYTGTQLVTEHPEFFLSNPNDSNNYLFNLGDETAREWLCDYIAGLLKEYGVNILRQDFNIAPLDYWRQADEENRNGITEMKYIEGLYLFWDGLRERCPGLIIDNCASGGRRLDFEALSRSVSLFRSDYQCYTTTSTAESCQMQIYGLNYWLPLTGAAAMGRTDSYNFRSNYGFAIQLSSEIEHYDEQIPLTAEFKSVREYFRGDYYPLTSCTYDQTGWFAYQLHRSDWDKGVICAFRRLQDDKNSLTVKLSGLDPDGTYQITVTDTGEVVTATGERLMEAGFTISIERKKDSRVIFYERVG